MNRPAEAQAGAIDLLIVGGGINGAGIARDAAGRGLSVMLVEQDDLAAHTSSASTKLVHGGLRYLETHDFRLVRESLIEREKLLSIAPHIIRPLAFVLPHRKGLRPAWLIRLGLFLYDHLGGRQTLPRSFGVRLCGQAYGEGLDPAIRRGFVYSDCWVDDARLVVLNALDAAAHGAAIRTRTRLTAAWRDGPLWRASLLDTRSGEATEITARALVNAAGPWVGRTFERIEASGPHPEPRLVKGSHIIVPRRFGGDHAFILQNEDGRVLFMIPYERDFTLIGTTDINWRGDPSAPSITDEEVAYLCAGVNHYLARPIGPADVVHSYSGVRALHDDGAASASKVTRDYLLRMDADPGPPLLSIFGGKITTYRRLAEEALERLAPFFAPLPPPWTASRPLPGGDIPDFARFLEDVKRRWPFLPADTARRLARAYGTRIDELMGDARSLADLGEDFGAGLTGREVDYLAQREWALSVEDILWRRTKLGLRMKPAGIERLSAYLETARRKLPDHAHG